MKLKGRMAWFLVAVLFLAVSLAGCGGNDAAPAPGPEAEQPVVGEQTAGEAEVVEDSTLTPDVWADFAGFGW